MNTCDYRVPLGLMRMRVSVGQVGFKVKLKQAEAKGKDHEYADESPVGYYSYS